AQPWWSAAILRTRAAAESLSADGWAAAAPHWRAAIDWGASRGALGEVGITLRAAASVAHHLGEHEAASTLIAAAPRLTAITVLSELFPDSAAFLAAHAPEGHPGDRAVDALAR